jgi:hypothetical protein
MEKTRLRGSVRSSDPTTSIVGTIDDSKHDTMREAVQRRWLLAQHVCIIHQTASVRPRLRLPLGRFGLAPRITCKSTPSLRYPSNGSNPENA